MKAVVEPLEGNKVKLSVEVDEAEFEKAIDAAFRKIAREVRIPGFRPGKAPRRLLEARLGKESGRAEALRDALPDYYSRAIRENEVDAIAAPDIDITSGEKEGPVAFDAVVEVRPRLHLAGYQGLRVEVPSPEVTEEEISSQIDRLRANFGELRSVDRPARDGDHLTIDLMGKRNGEDVSGLTTDDFLYELGSKSVLPELDDQLQGAKVGDIFEFDADVDGTVHFRVLVKDVKEKILPDVTDEWASESSEFDTVEELRADIAKRIGLVKRVQSTLALRNATVDAVVELVDVDAPAPLVDSEVQRRVHDLEHRLQAQNIGVAEYLQATGQTAEQVVESMREGAAQAVKADLALRAIADQEELEPTDEDINSEIDRMANAYGMKPAELRRNLDRAEQMPAVRSDWKKSKALEWLLERVEIVDPEGNPVDRALLEPAALEDEDPKEQSPTDESKEIDPETSKMEQQETKDQESGEQ